MNEELVNKIVIENGEGHKELREKVEAGEITKEIAAIIKLKANLKILSSKLSALISEA
jgi:hypothetical protein